tara:strand:- start:365 stop:595 length:231 start_codon:yes stop_codon:yes gene_type:complete
VSPALTLIVVLVMLVFKSAALRLVSIEQLVKGRILMIIGKKIRYHFIKANLIPSAKFTKTTNPEKYNTIKKIYYKA